MTIRRSLPLLALSVALVPALAAQEPVVWRSATARKPDPAVTLGKPVPLVKQVAKPVAKRPYVRAQAADYNIPEGSGRPKPPPTADPLLGDLTPPITGEMGTTIPLEPEAGVRPLDPVAVPAQAVDYRPPAHVVEQPPESAPPPPPPNMPSPPDTVPSALTDEPVAPGFWEKCRNTFNGGGGGSTGRPGWNSDSCLPNVVSPMTMPFFFEDPRAVCEVRPLFMYQDIPSSNPVANGGNAIFFGTQFRLAFNEHWSFVMHELGFLSVNPDTPNQELKGGTNFAEMKLGPKWTFLRSQETGTIGALGLIFEIPVGGAAVLQNIGSLSLTPYLSVGQTFGHLPGGYGSLNLIGNVGASFSVDRARSQFFYLNFHVDYNIANTNFIYPFFELNWLHYLKEGNSTTMASEGADLINFGSLTRQGDDYVALAGGLRLRVSDHVFTGIAAQFPVTKENGFSRYRITYDVIFRF